MYNKKQVLLSFYTLTLSSLLACTDRSKDNLNEAKPLNIISKIESKPKNQIVQLDGKEEEVELSRPKEKQLEKLVSVLESVDGQDDSSQIQILDVGISQSNEDEESEVDLSEGIENKLENPSPSLNKGERIRDVIVDAPRHQFSREEKKQPPPMMQTPEPESFGAVSQEARGIDPDFNAENIARTALPVLAVLSAGYFLNQYLTDRSEPESETATRVSGLVYCRRNSEELEIAESTVKISGFVKRVSEEEVSKSGFPRLIRGQSFFEVTSVQSWKAIAVCRDHDQFVDVMVKLDPAQGTFQQSLMPVVTKDKGKKGSIYRRLNKKSRFYLAPIPYMSVKKFMEHQDEQIRDSYLGGPRTLNSIRRLFQEKFMVKENLEGDYRPYGDPKSDEINNDFISMKSRANINRLKTAVIYFPLTGDESNAFSLSRFEMQYFLLSLTRDYRVFLYKVDELNEFKNIAADIGRSKVDLVIFGAHSQRSGMRFTSKENIQTSIYDSLNPFSSKSSVGFFSLGYEVSVLDLFKLKLRANMSELGKVLRDLDQSYFHPKTQILLLGCDTGKESAESYWYEGKSFSNIADYFAFASSKEVFAPNKSIYMSTVRAVTQDNDTSLEFYNSLVTDPSLEEFIKSDLKRNRKYFDDLETMSYGPR